MLQEMGVGGWLRHATAPLPEALAEPAIEPGIEARADAPVEADAAIPVARTPRVAPMAEPIAMPTTPQGARPSGIEQLDWPALREAVAGCTACGLCRTRTQTVFGVGHERARWMIVGEAPGEQEDRQGEPFVGKAGQLLDNMLRALGLSREPGEAERQVFICNVLKCRPPGNRNPEPAEVAQCEPFLLRQVQLVQPSIILAMGRFAVQSLLRTDEAIGRLRGRVHRYAGVPTIVTYHPAYLLRNLPDKAKAWDDLCLAAETLRRGEAGG